MPQRPVRALTKKQKILTLPAKTSVSEAALKMKQTKVGAAMVVEHGKLVGIFTERDALIRVLADGRDPRTTHVADVMTANPKTIHPDKPFGLALLMMYEGGFRHVPVVEDGRPIGMVSARDALGPELRDFQSELQRLEHIGEIL